MNVTTLLMIFAFGGCLVVWLGIVAEDSDIAGLGSLILVIAAAGLIFYGILTSNGPATAPAAQPISFCIPVTATPEVAATATATIGNAR